MIFSSLLSSNASQQFKKMDKHVVQTLDEKFRLVGCEFWIYGIEYRQRNVPGINLFGTAGFVVYRACADQLFVRDTYEMRFPLCHNYHDPRPPGAQDLNPCGEGKMHQGKSSIHKCTSARGEDPAKHLRWTMDTQEAFKHEDFLVNPSQPKGDRLVGSAETGWSLRPINSPLAAP